MPESRKLFPCASDPHETAASSRRSRTAPACGQVSKKPAQFDVVDGQQRIRAICEFCDGKYGLPKDTEAIDGNPVSGLKYEELPFDLRIKWDTYNLDVVVRNY
jgi:hypothetical protein